MNGSMYGVRCVDELIKNCKNRKVVKNEEKVRKV